MINALIDIGSNTIRLVVYDGEKEIYNHADYAELIKEVSGGKITENGVLKLCKSLMSMKVKSKAYRAKSIYAFATASLRDIEDKNALIKQIKEVTGIDIEIISSEKEAYYDFLGIKSLKNASEGLAFDLGGGSCQLMSFSDGEVKETVSLPIGSLKLHSLFVNNVLPATEEAEKIADFTKNQLNCLKQFNGYEVIYGMGGAVFALSALSAEYFEGSAICMETLEKLTKLSVDEINAVAPKRIKTVIPAAITMMSILRLSGAKVITPVEASVRDGIIYEMMHG